MTAATTKRDAVDHAVGLDDRNFGADVNANVDINVDLVRRGRPKVNLDVDVVPHTNNANVITTVRPTNNERDLSARRSPVEAKKRTTYTFGDYTVDVEDDGTTGTFTLTSSRVNLTTEAAPGGTAYDIQLPNSTLMRGPDDGAAALGGLTKKSTSGSNSLSTISGVASGGSAGIQYGDTKNSVGDGSTSFGTSADVAATVKELESRGSGVLIDELPVIGALMGSTESGSGIPGPAGAAGGLLGRDDLEARQGNLLGGLPVLGSLLGGGGSAPKGGSNSASSASPIGGLLRREDLNMLERQGNLLGGLPVLGSLLGGGGSTPKASSNSASSASPICGLLRREDLNMLERQGNLLGGLPVLGSLLGGGGSTPKASSNSASSASPIGGLLRRDGAEVVERQGSLLDGLPVVGSLLGGGGGVASGNSASSAGGVGGLLRKRVHSPMSSGEMQKRHSRSRARAQAGRT